MGEEPDNQQIVRWGFFTYVKSWELDKKTMWDVKNYLLYLGLERRERKNSQNVLSKEFLVLTAGAGGGCTD